MTRLALGAKCSGLMTPDQRSIWAVSPRSTSGFNRDARASMPMPALERPRKARRVSLALTPFIRSVPHNRFVQIENNTGHRGPCRQLSTIKVRRDRTISYLKEPSSHLLTRSVLLKVLVVQR